MKFGKYITMIAIAVALTSCGGSSDEMESDELDDEMELLENDYSFSESSSDDEYESEAYDDDEFTSSSSQDWDALLISYEQYVDKYISVMKKASKGDMSAMSEYPALLDKAQDFSNQMENAQGDMSASQWSRYMKITNKMTQAAYSMM